MPAIALARSYRRKYKKLHTQFSLVHGSTQLLEDEVKSATTIAMKLIAENDMLLDLLADIVPSKSPVPVREQISLEFSTRDERASSHYAELATHTAGASFAEPDYFESLPWDLDRLSQSGSYLEDLAKMQEAVVNTNTHAGATETPITNTLNKRLHARTPSSKKRERFDGDDEVNGTGGRKKKRKSTNLIHSESWEA